MHSRKKILRRISKKAGRRSSVSAKRNLVIGIDAGGTKIRGVLMRGTTILKRSEIFYNTKRITKELFLDSLYTAIEQLETTHVSRIGIGLPGTITNNRVVGAGNVKILSKIDVKKLVEKKYKTRVLLDNDVKVALRAEAHNHKQYNSLFMITLGTGIGGAWWLDKKIMRGEFGTAYEAGHIIMDKTPKHLYELEDFCGRKFFLRKGYDPLVSETKARTGNAMHKKLWHEFGTNLGIILANIANLIEPDAIIIGGGMAHAWPLYIATARKTMKRLILSKTARSRVRIVKTKSHKWIGALGAAMMAQGK